MITKVTIVLVNLLTVAVVIAHNINSWRPLIRPHESPLNIMTDIINNAGVKLLDCYIERPGNVAFSPTGLAFVLTALYEGSAGHTNRQLVHVLGLPRDRRVTRVGMRDIHRKLRSYLNADAFLGGLTLNRDDITLRPEYEDILRFYGFDVADTTKGSEIFNNSTNSTTSTSTPLPTTNLDAENDNNTTTVAENGETTPSSTLLDTMATTTNDGTTNADSVTSATANPNAETISATNDATSAVITANLINATDSSQTSGLTTPVAPTTASAIDMTTISATTSSATETTGNGASNSTSNGVTEAPTVQNANSAAENSTNSVNGTNDDNNVRKRRSFNQRRLLPVWFADLNDWQDYAASDDEFRESSSDQQHITELQFLVHNCDAVTVTTVTYTTVLPFAYFPSLHAIGLEFPLDDPRYNMIILVPTEGVDTHTLVRVLSSKTLRHLRDSLRLTWVKATIPSFMLRGFITLTPYLQQLGIKDAFEPRAADLTPMSSDLGIYARDVHQSIGVNIRNYMKDNGTENLANLTSNKDSYYSMGNILSPREPIPFTADRPFLFFIVDAETSVSLIAGRIDDPLNSRIV